MEQRLNKETRHRTLLEKISQDPFLTDEELAHLFHVSIPTVRLDRKELGIPEVRQRVKKMAEDSYAQIRSIAYEEIIGELIDVELNVEGLSILEVTPELVFHRTKIMRGHYIFAQANSLAVAIINAEVALTGAARIRYRRPVYLGEKLIAKARVTAQLDNKYTVAVSTKVGKEEVFSGKFVVVAVNNYKDGSGGQN